ncbi:MAG: hypothetical protein EON59_17705 [Alphaproteobacteria bacterium]|nr:MAG: hypothetical protein EON59_17705 [Alphaproteobacteria bacterium]
MLFEPNLRSVTPAGVDYVMSHFFHCHVPPETPVKVASTPPEPQIDEDDLACDEALLDAANV